MFCHSIRRETDPGAKPRTLRNFLRGALKVAFACGTCTALKRGAEAEGAAAGTG